MGRALTWLTHNHTCLPECTARLAPIVGLLTLECLLQMLWVATTNIGCAAVRCSEDLPWGPYNSMEPFDYTYVECRYSPPRAAFGDSAYQTNVLPIGTLHRSVFPRLPQTTAMQACSTVANVTHMGEAAQCSGHMRSSCIILPANPTTDATSWYAW
jgi:hypothetical protein